MLRMELLKASFKMDYELTNKSFVKWILDVQSLSIKDRSIKNICDEHTDFLIETEFLCVKYSN